MELMILDPLPTSRSINIHEEIDGGTVQIKQINRREVGRI